MNYCSCCGGRVRPAHQEDTACYECVSCAEVFYDNPKPCVAAVIVDGERLLLARRAIEPGLDKWDLIGGFLDRDELPEQALRREVREELGVEIAKLELLGFYMDVYGKRGDSTLNITYVCRIDGEPTINTHELKEIGWFTSSELPGDYAFQMVARVLEEYCR